MITTSQPCRTSMGVVKLDCLSRAHHSYFLQCDRKARHGGRWALWYQSDNIRHVLCSQKKGSESRLLHKFAEVSLNSEQPRNSQQQSHCSRNAGDHEAGDFTVLNTLRPCLSKVELQCLREYEIMGMKFHELQAHDMLIHKQHLRIFPTSRIRYWLMFLTTRIPL